MPPPFTPDEANALLPVLQPLVETMVAAKRGLDDARAERELADRRIAGNGGGLQPAELAALAEEVGRRAEALASAIQEIQGLGVLVKDLDTGLVDFPALREGREVLLCWRLGERSVAHWHRPEDGLAGRRPL